LTYSLLHDHGWRITRCKSFRTKFWPMRPLMLRLQDISASRISTHVMSLQPKQAEKVITEIYLTGSRSSRTNSRKNSTNAYNRDLSYGIAFFPHQLQEKIDQRRCHCQQIVTMRPLEVRRYISP
jgi:hypothetical protein